MNPRPAMPPRAAERDDDDLYERLLRQRTPPPAAPPTKSKAPRIGFLSPQAVERAFIWLMYGAVGLLALLSVLGTFYGLRGEDAPLVAPVQALADIAAAPDALLVALAVQTALGLSQYGARLMARHDRRWWILYLVSLGVSVYYNVLAYFDPLVALNVPMLFALILIIVGDVLPERVAIRRE